jgi:hypothetical protein
MLKLFQSIFSGGREQGRYPESLVEAAIERAVDGTDPRLRALPGYRRRLRAPVIHAIDHVIAMVDSLPDPLAADTAGYGNDARLGTLFASAKRMLEVFGHDPELSEFRKANPGEDRRITALLLAERLEKNVMGMELSGDVLRRDVAQVAISFRGHRLADPAASEAETRRQLKRRGFDHLLSLALMRISDVQGERAGLGRQRDLLRRKYRDLERGGWNFDEAGPEAVDHARLQADLEEVEAQLATLGVDQHALNAHLEIAAGVLADAEQHLWSENIDLCLDRMNIVSDTQNASARSVSFQELHNTRGNRVVMLLLAISPGELPRKEDFFSAAERYLV